MKLRIAFHLRLLLGGSLAILIFVAGCTSLHQDKANTVSGGSLPMATETADYVGNAACGECHPNEFKSHQHSRHATTMRPASPVELGALAPPTGPIASSPYTMLEKNGEYTFRRTDQAEPVGMVKFALGSGKDAMTFIGDFTPETLTEFRMTYLPGQKQWTVTPGQERLANLNLGLTHELGLARSCVLCHAMKRVVGSTEPDARLVGVGCESCHGPGSTHVAAAKSGKASNLGMSAMSKWSAEQVNQMCDRCHRSMDDVTLDQEDAVFTSRFQGYGITLSPCFQKSGGKLSCITCHDPHANVAHDNRYYEKICLTCHGAAAATGQRVVSCPVNQKEKCIQCHMPQKPIFFEQHISMSMADHFITKHNQQ